MCCCVPVTQYVLQSAVQDVFGGDKGFLSATIQEQIVNNKNKIENKEKRNLILGPEHENLIYEYWLSHNPRG